MKVLLINTPLFNLKTSASNEDYLPPYGLGYIATQLQKNNIEVELLDAVQLRLTPENLIVQINSDKPDFLALNIFTTNYDIVRKLVESLNTDIHIIIGGLATKALFEKIINWKTKNPLDIVIGDGELILSDIIKNNVKENCYLEIRNRRVFKVDKFSKYFVKEISNMPLNRNLLKNEPVKNVYGKFEANLITSRGCIYDCSFCGAARSQNKDFNIRERSNASIEKEINEVISLYPEIESIRILDDLFLKSKDTIRKAAEIFSKFKLEWRSMAHIRTFSKINQEYIEELKHSGCRELFVGIESGSPRLLKYTNKTTNIELIKSNLIKVFKTRIDVKGYFMYGLPGETVHDAQMTYTLASELKKLSVQYGANFRTSVFQFRPYHGTQIYQELCEKYSNFRNEKIIQNKELTSLIGREQFNFYTNNYSNISLDTIHDYICKTNMIKWDKKTH